AADELVTTRAFHAVYAQIGATDAHRILGGPGACRVVLGGDQPMARIERRGHGSAEVHITEPHHEVARAEYDVTHLRAGFESIDAPDELDVVRAPGRVCAHRLL